MSGNIFVDTNILVYSRDSSEPVKQVIAIDRLKELWQAGTGKIRLCEHFGIEQGNIGPDPGQL